MRFGAVPVVIWLVIGVLAAAQRGYVSGDVASYTKVSTLTITVVAGPLNYLGVNPTISCKTPPPSK